MSVVIERITAALSAKASDITLTPERGVRIRLPQKIASLPVITNADFNAFLDSHCKHRSPSGIGSFSLNAERYRFIYYKTESGPTLEIRHLPKDLPNISNLNVPPQFMELLKAPRGLIIVTGATGSGKTTTLAAAIDHLNSTSDDLKIITLEDPIEYLHPEKKSVIRQCEYGRDFPDFAAAIKALLRQDPDIALIGELRDPESIGAALTAAETGHLVFTTLHTKDAPGSVSRILDSAASSDALASFSGSLVGILAQQLVPTLDGKKVAAYELLTTSTAVKNCIRDKRIDHLRDELRRGSGQGMITMDASLEALCRAKRISKEVALERAHDRTELEKKLSNLRS